MGTCCSLRTGAAAVCRSAALPDTALPIASSTLAAVTAGDADRRQSGDSWSGYRTGTAVRLRVWVSGVYPVFQVVGYVYKRYRERSKRRRGVPLEELLLFLWCIPCYRQVYMGWTTPSEEYIIRPEPRPRPGPMCELFFFSISPPHPSTQPSPTPPPVCFCGRIL